MLAVHIPVFGGAFTGAVVFFGFSNSLLVKIKFDYTLSCAWGLLHIKAL
jgi:hypothetical protein